MLDRQEPDNDQEIDTYRVLANLNASHGSWPNLHSGWNQTLLKSLKLFGTLALVVFICSQEPDSTYVGCQEFDTWKLLHITQSN